MHLKKLVPMLSVVDLKRTITFYCDELEFRCTGKFGDPDPVWCYLERDGASLMFNQPPAAEMAELPRRAKDFQIYYFYPEDVVALHQAWTQKGLPVGDLRVTEYRMREFELRDPDGYWLWFGQQTSDPPTAIFGGLLLPFLLLAPQLLVTFVFFYWPASQAVWQSFLLQDAFGLKTDFVWFENYSELLKNPDYYQAMGNTFVFALAVTLLSLSISLFLATQADKHIKGAGIYKTLLIWPYAVAPAIAGVLWLFMFQPSLGIVARGLRSLGMDWNPLLNGAHAMTLVVMAATWKQISYNFLFFLAGLQSIPKSVHEAAAIDGAKPLRRFWTVTFPLLSPTAFFLLVVNIVYVFFDTFGIIDAVTGGGPAKATETLVYKVYQDGRLGGDLGGSAAQSVILMIIVVALTAVQFRYIDRKVNY